jgi:hypothetical protein
VHLPDWKVRLSLQGVENQQHLCSEGGTEISVVGPHQLNSVLSDTFQQFVVRRAAPALVDDACSAASSVGDDQTTCVSRADAKDRSRRRFSAPPGQNLSKDLYALQLVSAPGQKFQSPPPPTVGRVVWTFQLCRNRTLLLCIIGLKYLVINSITFVDVFRLFFAYV